MSRAPIDRRLIVQRRLGEVGQKLTRAREELTALQEQIAWFVDAADDARLRALVSESKVDQREYREVERHSRAMARGRSDLQAHIERLRRLQEELLDDLPLPATIDGGP